MLKYVGGYNPTASSLVFQFVELNNNISTSSTTFQNSCIEITVLETGLYWMQSVVAVTNFGGTGLDRESETTVFRNNSAIEPTRGSAGTVMSGVSLANNGYDATITGQTVIQLTAGDLLQLRYRRVSGGDSVNATNRSLMILKVG